MVLSGPIESMAAELLVEYCTAADRHVEDHGIPAKAPLYVRSITRRPAKVPITELGCRELSCCLICLPLIGLLTLLVHVIRAIRDESVQREASTSSPFFGLTSGARSSLFMSLSVPTLSLSDQVGRYRRLLP